MNANLFRVIVLVLSCVFITSNTTLANNDTTTKPYFLGYLSGHPDKINYQLFTHICHAFLVADEEGRIVKRESVPSRKLTTEAHQAKVQVILSLGGWGMDKEFAALTSKEASYERFVTSVMKIIDEYDYDGIDLDWEFPDNPTEVKNFNRLTRRFRKELNTLGQRKKRHLLLTMAVNAGAGLSKWLNTQVLLKNMDFINVMTYDFFGAWSAQAGHHSALFESSKAKGRSTQQAMDHWHRIKGIPKDKLLVGLPLYSRGFAAAKPYDPVNRDASNAFTARAYRDLHQLIKDGWTYTWDDETKNPWLTSPQGDYVHSYDNEHSLAIKTDWAIEQGYRGVFFWEIKQDRLKDGSNPLLEAAHKALVKKSNIKPQAGVSGTFSIVAVDPENGVCGAAVASKYPAVGKVVPYVRAGVGAFCTQHWHNPEWGECALDMLAQGKLPEQVLAELLRDDPRRDKRQLAIIDMSGRAANRNPSQADPSGIWWGAASGKYYACQGNTLTGREVISAMAKAYEETKGSLADRLMAALVAGDRAGGDHRGRLAAGIRVAKEGIEGHWLELYVDKSDDAVVELAKKYKQMDN